MWEDDVLSVEGSLIKCPISKKSLLPLLKNNESIRESLNIELDSVPLFKNRILPIK